jgi:hypothetical protein
MDEGRRSMQRWMRPIAATQALDISQFTGPANLETLGRLASDALRLLGSSAPRKANLPSRPMATATAAPSIGVSDDYDGDSPISEPIPRRNGTSHRPQVTTITSSELAPAEQRTDGRRRRRESDDTEPSATPQRSQVRGNGDIRGSRIHPSFRLLKSLNTTALDPAWGKVAKVP